MKNKEKRRGHANSYNFLTHPSPSFLFFRLSLTAPFFPTTQIAPISSPLLSRRFSSLKISIPRCRLACGDSTSDATMADSPKCSYASALAEVAKSNILVDIKQIDFINEIMKEFVGYYNEITEGDGGFFSAEVRVTAPRTDCEDGAEDNGSEAASILDSILINIMQCPSSLSSVSHMWSNLLDPRRSPEAKHESPCNPSVQKEVVLFEWWLSKAEKGYNGSRLTIGGFSKSGEGMRIFRSAPIIKRHDQCTLETADGITLRIQGSINKTRTIDNGFPLEASNAFLFGFPTIWDNFTEPPSGNKPFDSKMFEHQPENTFDPSFQQITVLLRNWWLRKAEKGFDGKRLAVGGFTECGKAMRLFDSSPIIKRHDAYTIETADGITIRIEGFINKMRTLDNGFPVEACRTFLIGFPTTWTDFANVSSWEKSSEIPVSGSQGAERSKDSHENVPFEFPVKLEDTILHNVPSTSSTSVRDSDTKFQKAIRKFTAWVSMCNSAHIPLVDSGLPEKSCFDNNRLQDEENCGANMRDAHSNNQLQDDERCGTNLRDAQTGNDYEVGHIPVDNDSENHEARYTEGVHTEGAGCLTGDLHVDRLPQEKSLSHEKLTLIQDATLNICKKCCGHEVAKDHHEEGEGTCSIGKFCGSVVGKDHWTEKTAQKKDEKFDECSTRRPEEVRPGLSKVENLHGEYQKYAKFTTKPVRRSLRLKSLNPENVHGECQYNSHLFNKTNDMNYTNLVPDGSKTCKISQPTDTLAEGCSSSTNLYVEPQNFAKSLAKPVRRSKRLVLMDHANLPQDGSKTYAKSQPNYTILKGSPLSLTSSILLPSSGVLPEENHDGNQHSINTCLGVTSNSNSASKYACYDDSASIASLGQSLNVKNTFSSDCASGLVEVTPNSKAVTSQIVGKRILRCSRKKKINQTPRSRTKVEQDDSRKQSSGISLEEKTSFSSAYFSKRKAKNIDISTETHQAEDKASHKMECKTVWTSSYTKIHCTPLTRYQNKKSTNLKPESLKRSRSGRLLIPSLDCSTTKVVYEPDGSFVGTATVNLSCAPIASVAMSTSPSKGRGRKKRKKLQ